MGIYRRGFLMGHYAFVVVGLFTRTIVVLLMASVVHGKIGIPPKLPLQYQGSGNTLQTLLNLSWPAAQGVGSTFTLINQSSYNFVTINVKFTDSSNYHQ
jgi:hypothetical protein